LACARRTNGASVSSETPAASRFVLVNFSFKCSQPGLRTQVRQTD
jgi:hypothetical protein